MSYIILMILLYGFYLPIEICHLGIVDFHHKRKEGSGACDVLHRPFALYWGEPSFVTTQLYASESVCQAFRSQSLLQNTGFS